MFSFELAIDGVEGQASGSNAKEDEKVDTREGEGAKRDKGRLKKYELVADRLRGCIRDGVYAHKLPGVRVLADELETNVMTLGSAIKLLVAEGLLYRVPRSGTYVQKVDDAPKGVIGFIVNDVQAANTSRILARVGELAAQRDLNLLFFNHRNDRNLELEILKRVASEGMVDGIIWWPSTASFGSVNQGILLEAKLPFVAVGTTWPEIGGSSVVSDHFAGFRDLTTHLLDCGLEKVLFVTDHGTSETEPKYLAYRSVMEVRGLDYGHPFIVSEAVLEGEASPEEIDEVVGVLCEADGLLCLHDRFAARVYRLLQGRLGVDGRMPALAGYDGLDVAELLGLTTFDQPFDQVGEAALDVLVERIEDEKAPHRKLFLKGRLVPRESTLDFMPAKKG